MKKSTRKSIVWLLVMTLFVITFNVMPIMAGTPRSALEVGEYVKYGTYEEKDILWKVVEKDERGILLYQDKLIKDGEYEEEWIYNRNWKNDKNWKYDKPDNFNRIRQFSDIQSLSEKDNFFIGMLTGFYIHADSIVFKTGEGTRENPYTLYTEWKETPVIKANGNKVTLSHVELIGTQSAWENLPNIHVDHAPQNITNIAYDATNKVLTYELGQAIKQNQRVDFSYTLSDNATSALAKAGEKLVLKQVTMQVANETIDYRPQPVVITKGLQDEWVKAGEKKQLTVTAKGEGQLTFNWYRNDGQIQTEYKDSYNQEVNSSYTINPVKVDDIGIYRVEVIGTSGKAETKGQINVTNQQYKVQTTVYPANSGNVTNNSPLQNGVYNVNDMATLTAHPTSRYYFVNWTENGKEVSRDRAYTFKVTKDRNLVANFRWDEPEYIPQYRIHIAVTPDEGGTIRGDYTYNKGEHVTVKAKPNEGYIFDSWTEDGEVVSRNEEYSFTVKEERWLKANFEEEEKGFKEQWKDLSDKKQEAVEKNFEEYLPYTTLDEELTIEQLDKLTKGYFTRDGLREVSKDIDLLQDVGIDLDWEKIKLKKVSYVDFKDLPTRHWAYDNITRLAKKGIVTGYPDETFKPNQPLTVADTFTFLDRVLLINEEVEVKQPRSFVERYIEEEKSWSFPHVASIASKLDDDTIKTIGKMGDQYVSRELLAQVLYEVTDGDLRKTEPLVNFTDTRYCDYKDGINYCIRTGLLEGTSASTMEPYKPVTRAEMMTILQRLDDALN